MPRLDGDHDVDKVTPVQPRPAVDSEISYPCQRLTGNVLHISQQSQGWSLVVN